MENSMTLRFLALSRNESFARAAASAFFTTAPAEERSGMGFSVMEAFMDSLNVESSPGKGTRVTMTKRVGEQK